MLILPLLTPPIVGHLFFLQALNLLGLHLLFPSLWTFACPMPALVILHLLELLVFWVYRYDFRMSFEMISKLQIVLTQDLLLTRYQLGLEYLVVVLDTQFEVTVVIPHQIPNFQMMLWVIVQLRTVF